MVIPAQNPMDLRDLTDNYHGFDRHPVLGVSTPEDSDTFTLCFVETGNIPERGIVVCDMGEPHDYRAIIPSSNPRLTFALLLHKLFPSGPPPPTLNVARSANIAREAVLGATGLSYAQDGPEYVEVYHLGGVVIGEDVDLGPYTVVMRGNLMDTRIGDGTKIGNRVTVGHNVQVGRNCFIAPGVVLCGSCVLEDNATVYANAVVLNHVRVGERATVGAGAVVTRDVPAGVTVVGDPAKEIGKG